MLLHRFRPYFNYLKPVKVQFGVGLLAGLIYATSSGFGLPYVTKHLVPLVTNPEKPESSILLGYLALVPIMFALRALGSFVNSYFIAYSGMYVLERIRRKVFDHIQKLPLGFFQKNKSGDLMSRVLVDTTLLQAAIVKVVDSLIKEPATLLAAGCYLIYLSFQAADISFILIALASIPACVLPIRFIGQAIIKKATLAQAQAGELNHVLNENLSATREIRAYNLESQQSERFAETCARFFKQSMKVVKYDKALTPIIEIVTAGALVGALYIAIEQDIDAGALASILVALYMCYQPTKKLGSVSNTIRQAEASLNRLEYILHTEDTVPDAIDPIDLGVMKGHIQFENVSFQYADEPVLQSVSTEIPAGQSVALVGPSGAGKSTFANLVPRFYDVTSGCISIDGFDIRTISKADLRAQIALVSQEAVLFGDTIANNIRLGKPLATDAEIIKAAQMANAHTFIEALEEGYETRVGERGARLSGGERQRIAIARAFLKDAPIIILDEPTSALDAESEHQIQAALEELSRGRTVIIIAHRFSTIQHANSILVFESGTVIASGTHAQLYPKNSLYKNLYDKQSKTALED